MGKKRTKTYTLEFKKSSARLAATSDKPISQIADNLGVNVNTLYGWIKKYRPNAGTRETLPADLESEVKQLRKENAHLKQERDILKKAAAYFAKETL